MTIPFTHNIGAYLRSEPALPPGFLGNVASDGTAETLGRVVDRLALGRKYDSVKLVVSYNGNTQSSTGVQCVVRFLGASASGATFATVAAVSTSTGISRTSAQPATSTATSTSHAGTFEYDFDLRNAPRYFQCGIAPKLGASSSGSMGFGAVYIFGGADELPPVAPVDRATTS